MCFVLKLPIILTNNTNCTDLIIVQHHQVGHSGTGHTCTPLRQTFWEIEGGAAVSETYWHLHILQEVKRISRSTDHGRITKRLSSTEKPPFSAIGVDRGGRDPQILHSYDGHLRPQWRQAGHFKSSFVPNWYLGSGTRCFRNGDCYVRCHWRKIQWMTEEFWWRWSPDYLPILLPRKKWTTTERQIQLCDVVRMVDRNWKNICVMESVSKNEKKCFSW